MWAAVRIGAARTRPHEGLESGTERIAARRRPQEAAKTDAARIRRIDGPLFKQTQAEEALGQAVDVLARPFRAATNCDDQDLDVGLVNSIDDSKALTRGS